MLTKNGGGDRKRRLSRVHCICTMHCVQCTLEKQCTANHVISTISKPSVNPNWSYSPETLNSAKNRRFFFVPCDLEIWQMTSENNRAHLLYCFKLCASFHSHQWIQTKVTVRKRSIRVKFGDFFCPVWPWNLTDDLEKTIGHLFYVASSFLYHFIAIGESKPELQSRNAQFGSKSAIFLSRVTLKFDGRP